jgi:hypothetical protein
MMSVRITYTPPSAKGQPENKISKIGLKTQKKLESLSRKREMTSQAATKSGVTIDATPCVG